MNSHKFKFLSTLLIMSSFLLSSCSQPSSTKTVTIDKHYILMADEPYIVNTNYNVYWPYLTIRNRSVGDAYIEFSYYFTVDGTLVTGPGLAQTVTLFAVKGVTTWEMPRHDRMAISRYTMVDEHYISRDDVGFCWTVLSVSKVAWP